MQQSEMKPVVVPVDDSKPLLKSENTPADLVLSWKNVSYSVKVKKDQKVLLDNVSGFVSSGQVVAIMGGSGAGKTTLLNCLAGRIGPGTLSGSILVNNAVRSPKHWQRLCAYVEQDDIMYSNLSVLETLTYSAMLRLPSSVSLEEKKKRVEEIIMTLGLNACRDTRIGNSLSKGVSGGERKRVAIGIELVTQPKLLFLDEPTSGLDSFNALNVIESIKSLAVEQKKAFLMTIHQPRNEILESIDRIVILSAGKTVWFGSVQDALVHFADLKYPLPPKTNPADFFLDIVTVDQRTVDLKEKSMRRIKLFQESWDEKFNNAIVFPKTTADANSGLKKNWPSTWIGEFTTLFGRNMKQVFRDPGTIGATLGQGVMILLIFGFIFFKVTLDAAGVQNRLGIFFMLSTNATFGVVMPTINLFPLEREIIKRERSAGTYRSSSAFLAKVLSSLPLLIVGNLILSCPIYWMVGLQNDSVKYLTFIVILLAHVWVANSMGLMIGSAITNLRIGQIFGPLIIVVMLLFGGQVLNLEAVPDVFKWLQWISIISYTNKALTQNELTGLEFNLGVNRTAVPGSEIIDTYKLGNPSLWYCILINASLGIAFLIIGLFAFTRTSAPLLKLK